MILLCDEGVDRLIVEHLRAQGHEVIAVSEMKPGMTDEEVLAEANRRQALLVTLDKDFGDLVFRQERLSTGVLLLRLYGLEPDEKRLAVATAIRLHGTELWGSFSVVSQGKLRIRQRVQRLTEVANDTTEDPADSRN